MATATATHLPDNTPAKNAAEVGKAKESWLSKNLKALCSCVSGSASGLLWLIAGCLAIYVGEHHRTTKCSSNVAFATLAIGICFCLNSLSTLVDAVYSLVASLRSSKDDKQKTKATERSNCGKLIRSISKYSYGAVLGLLVWVGYELFRDDLWSKVHDAASPEAAPCDPGLYKPVAYVYMGISGSIVLFCMMYLTMLSVLSCCSSQNACAKSCAGFFNINLRSRESGTAEEKERILQPEAKHE